MWKLRDPNQRLLLWKKFRITLNDLDLENALQETVDFWCSPPWAPFYLDEEDPKSWPGPWDLIVDNYFCDIAKALGMIYTIYLTNHRPDVELNIYQDPDTGGNLTLVVINKKYVLNMNSGQVLNRQYIEDSLLLRHTYSSKELNLEKYI